MNRMRWFAVIAIAGWVSVWLPACGCEDEVDVYVLAGHRSADDCKQAARKGGAGTPVFICPGEEVTVCWNANKNVELGPNLGHHGTSGVLHLTPQSDMTITAKAGCASATDTPIKVVTSATKSTWDATFVGQCPDMGFGIDAFFMSPNVKAIDITAQWNPVLTADNGTITDICETPPFLDGFHQEEVFGFAIDRPLITKAFSRPLRAVGHWKFKLTARCHMAYFCKAFASFPFDLTLTCNR